MKQVFCVQFNDTPTNAIDVRDVDMPHLADDQVLIGIITCPINPADLLLLTGRHFYRPSLPASIGIEGVGRVLEKGSSVHDLTVGDVVAVPFGGTWREYMVMKEQDVMRVPPDLDLSQASMLSVNPVTAAGLIEGVAAGNWILQNAANSAVGQLVIRLAAHRGIKTVNIVRRAELIPELKSIGADVVLVGDNNLPERIREATGGAEILRGLDAIAGDATGNLHRGLNDGGELICYGLLNSNQIVLGAADVVFRNITIKGYSRLRLLGQMSINRRNELIKELTDLLRLGVLRSPIEQIYPLAKVHQAVEHADRSGRSGKILLNFTS